MQILCEILTDLFVASDATRIAESKKELDGLLSDPDLATTPFVILGNKIDIDGAMSEPQLRDFLGLHQTTGKGVVAVPENMRPIEIFMVRKKF
jgi:GTP-binding protein SAR1